MQEFFWRQNQRVSEMTNKKENAPLSETEISKRFEAALRGARMAAPHPMKDIPPKRVKKRASKADPEAKE
jgi:hypothetical protein